MKFKVKKDLTSLIDMQKKMAFMADNQLYVGIPQEHTNRKEGVTNAELLFIHTNGSPIKNIPPRPVIEPVLENNKQRIQKRVNLGIKTLLETGNEEKALGELKKAGIDATNLTRRWFKNPENGWPPNSPSTARRKRRKGSTTIWPLIDTQEMLKSITYVLVNKNNREVGPKK